MTEQSPRVGRPVPRGTGRTGETQPSAEAGAGKPAGACGAAGSGDFTLYRAGAPPVAATDRGGVDWERVLVAAARARGFAWRPEATYINVPKLLDLKRQEI